jgi:hypothetical protein
VIPKASFPSVKSTYTFDLGDDWTHACEVVAQDSRRTSPARRHTCAPACRPPIFGWGTIPDHYGRLRDNDQT